jgi:SRSO17 transposase
MTPEQIAALGPALTEFVRPFDRCFQDRRSMSHFQEFCRGLLSDLPRKSVEPIALAAGTTVRVMQMFLTHRHWEDQRMRQLIQQRVAARHAPPPGAARGEGDLGAIGLIDETSAAKKGDKTPGVQRQYLGSVGKIDNGIVTVHLGYECHGFKTLLDSDLYLPKEWADDRPRCREAYIPDDLPFRTKPQIALEQVKRAIAHGVRFDWLTFDEGYGRNMPLLRGLEQEGQLYVAEVPRDMRCWPTRPKYRSLRTEFAARKVCNVSRWSPAFVYQPWRSFTMDRQTVEPAVWDVKAAQVYLPGADGQPTDRTYWLIVAWNRATDESKYFVSNAPPTTDLALLLRVAFRRYVIEHLFRIGKSEVGMTHFEGRSYVGLIRHLTLCQLMILFLAEHTDRLRGEKSAGHDGAGGLAPVPPLSGEPTWPKASPIPRHTPVAYHPVPPAPQ